MEELCTACLCTGRNLYFIGDTSDFDLYLQILNEIRVDTSALRVLVCWECRALLRRLRRFRALVRSSHMLLTKICGNSVENVARAPHLAIHKVSLISLPFDDVILKPEPEAELNKEEARPLSVVKSEPDDVTEHSEETFVNDLLVEKPVDEPPRSKTKEKTKSKLKVKKVKKSIGKKNNIVNKKMRKRKRKISVSSESIDNVDVGIDCDTASVNGEEIEEKLSEKEIQEETAKEEGVSKKAVNGSGPRVPLLDNERPQCAECGKVFSSRKTYRYHLNVLHKGQNRYPCPRCGKVYQWKSNLGRHMRSHKARDAGELYCGECDKRFASVATYRQHLKVSRQHVSESEFSFMCTDCGKKFVNKTRLRDHVDWEHLNNIKFRCQLCNKPFKCHTSLYVHMQNVHRNKEKKDNLCHVCGKSYQNAAKLKYHIIAMHTHETPYRCAHCAAAFGWYSSLYRHVREVHYKMKVQPKKSKRPKKGELPPLVPVSIHPAMP
ncbi:zinc finger protein 569-like [Plodia interpunctella]|uniref:zinc finger protein 569-like n=1 Tax=Plodia interpunctella TaxID=58824 RepID=UPI002368EB61|nr:zinc finger protein 569-like [Plodia interpunctella]